jgi:peptide/nickel transport system ATP-binding protein
LGLVGESGSGKTTLARAVMGLVDKTDGDMTLISAELPSGLSGRDLETLRSLQMVFQDPDGALNPYLTVGESLRRPLISLLGLSRSQADADVKKLLNAVHLPDNFDRRLPGQLSGGENQRVAIARAFATNPALLICDEPVSSLDVSVQASILNLLNQLQAKNQSGMIFISHDLAVVGYLADTIAVMYAGHIMETGASVDLFEPPYHPYTEALISAIPRMDPTGAQEHIPLGETHPSPSTETSGCPFHSRCPRILGDICVQTMPPWRETPSGKRIYCHIPLDELRSSQTPRIDLHNGSQDR